MESQLFSPIKRPCLPGGVWREFTRDSRTVRCMEAANDYITQSIGVLSKHGRSLKGIRRVEVFDIDPGDAMTVNRRLPLTFELSSKSSCRRVLSPARMQVHLDEISLHARRGQHWRLHSRETIIGARCGCRSHLFDSRAARTTEPWQAAQFVSLWA